MAFRPTKLPRWADNGGDIVEPTAGRKDVGWETAQKPSAQFFNWWQNLVYQWFQWLDSIPHGPEILVASVEDRVPAGGTDNAMTGAAYGPAPAGPQSGGDDLGTYVTTTGAADGNGPDIYRSVTGRKYVVSGSIPSGTGNGVADVLHDGTNFVGVGGSSNGFTSPDGDVWTKRTCGLQQPKKLVNNGNRLIAIGTQAVPDPSNSATSTDNGATWTVHAGAFSTAKNNGIGGGLGANLADGRVICVDGDNQIQSSDDDGLTFTVRNAASAAIGGFTEDLFDVHHENGVWIAVGDHELIIRSIDNGVNWTAIQGDSTPTQNYRLSRVINVFGTWYAFGGDRTNLNRGYVQVSKDEGLNWSPKIALTEFDILAVAFDGTGFVLAGQDASNFAALASTARGISP